MSNKLFICIGILWLTLGFLMIGHAIYFYYRYQRDLDKFLMGDHYFDGGLLYNIMCRQGIYAQASILPSKLRTWYLNLTPLIDRDKFIDISPKVWRSLIIQYVLIISTGVAMGVMFFVMPD